VFEQELSTRGDHRFWPLMNGLDDLGVVDAAQVSGGDREVGVPELALDHDQRGGWTTKAVTRDLSKNRAYRR
jgi:hypothetical protein